MKTIVKTKKLAKRHTVNPKRLKFTQNEIFASSYFKNNSFIDCRDDSIKTKTIISYESKVMRIFKVTDSKIQFHSRHFIDHDDKSYTTVTIEYNDKTKKYIFISKSAFESVKGFAAFSVDLKEPIPPVLKPVKIFESNEDFSVEDLRSLEFIKTYRYLNSMRYAFIFEKTYFFEATKNIKKLDIFLMTIHPSETRKMKKNFQFYVDFNKISREEMNALPAKERRDLEDLSFDSHYFFYTFHRQCEVETERYSGSFMITKHLLYFTIFGFRSRKVMKRTYLTIAEFNEAVKDFNIHHWYNCFLTRKKYCLTNDTLYLFCRFEHYLSRDGNERVDKCYRIEISNIFGKRNQRNFTIIETFENCFTKSFDSETLAVVEHKPDRIEMEFINYNTQINKQVTFLKKEHPELAKVINLKNFKKMGPGLGYLIDDRYHFLIDLERVKVLDCRWDSMLLHSFEFHKQADMNYFLIFEEKHLIAEIYRIEDGFLKLVTDLYLGNHSDRLIKIYQAFELKVLESGELIFPMKVQRYQGAENRKAIPSLCLVTLNPDLTFKDLKFLEILPFSYNDVFLRDNTWHVCKYPRSLMSVAVELWDISFDKMIEPLTSFTSQTGRIYASILLGDMLYVYTPANNGEVNDCELFCYQRSEKSFKKFDLVKTKVIYKGELFFRTMTLRLEGYFLIFGCMRAGDYAVWAPEIVYMKPDFDFSEDQKNICLNVFDYDLDTLRVIPLVPEYMQPHVSRFGLTDYWRIVSKTIAVYYCFSEEVKDRVDMFMVNICSGKVFRVEFDQEDGGKILSLKSFVGSKDRLVMRDRHSNERFFYMDLEAQR